MKRSRLLEEAHAQADLPYEETPLAKRAARSRPRLALLLLVGVAGFALESVLVRSAWWLAGAGVIALVAWGVHRGKLVAIIATGFVAVVAFGVPIALAAMSGDAWRAWIAPLFVSVWALTLMPDLFTLVRDAELQNAYGLWAREPR